MPALLRALLLFAAPFWDARPPEQWTDAELKQILTDSPWVQGVSPNPIVAVMLATARPVEEAEAEVRRRGISHPAGIGKRPDIDYTDYVARHRDEHFVLAIPYATLAGLGRAEEEERLEKQTVMQVGRKRYELIGHFPPTPSDPVLRLIFPRVVTVADRNVSFDLYLPGVSQPARIVEFRVKDLVYRGKLEM